ncbi:hypothetical protein [Actinorugispora endophytica]|uniref:Uncharacterized protein n=1 Tax=Actinorugispora endophytica TaxID=1605990 RepID=A0A4R6UBG6_9ACTN|nr:hypothetical protein [Actinorugispora endophytica]TDQ43921.1 hypothetical protein EV190_13819 [Actinorugispora endophytica]
MSGADGHEEPEAAEEVLPRAANTIGGDVGNSVQTGSVEGDVVIQIGGALLRQEVVAAARWDPAELERLRAVFVAPRGFGAFTGEVRRGGLGFVTGRVGGGRWTAAVCCALELGLVPRSITVDTGEEWNAAGLPSAPGHAYLLDLSEVERLSERMVREIRGYAVGAAERGAAVLVVTRVGLRGDGDAGLPVLDVVPPPAPEVFSRHLGEHCPGPAAERWLADADVRGALSGAAPAEAARLARIAARSRPEGFLDGDVLAAWIGDALGAFRNWRGEIASLFTGAAGEADAGVLLYDRVLLTAVAMFEGEDASVVLGEAERIADLLGVPPAYPTRLSGPGRDRLLARVGARGDERGRVRFTRAGYADAVLDYLWEQYPVAVMGLLEWSRRLASSGEAGAVPERWLRAVGARWTGMAERNGRPDWLVDVLTAWSGTASARRVVVEMGSTGAVHLELGGAVRRRLYTMAKEPRGTIRGLVVAEVCANYGRVHPNTALTRLKWLADAADPKIRSAVLAALGDLAEADGLGPVVMAELLGWERDKKERGRREVAVEALAGMLRDGGPALAEDAGALLTARAWEAVLDAGPGAGRPAVGAWLSAVAAGDADPRVVADVFGRVVAGNFPRYRELARLVALWREAAAPVSGPVERIAASLEDADPLRAVSSWNGAGR